MSGPCFSIIPGRAVTDHNLKARDLQVLCLLGIHTDDYGWCRRSQVKMAEQIGCARSTVYDAIERLVRAGYLERHVQQEDSGRDSPHVYRVMHDPVHPQIDDVPDTDTPCRYIDTPAGSGPAPKNDPLRTIRERRVREAEDKGLEKAELRALEMRVKKLAHKLSWPNWERSSTEWVTLQFAALSEADRSLAEERGAAYLAHCGKKALLSRISAFETELA